MAGVATNDPRRAPHDPTLIDVAALAGVSRSTASRAINGGTKVSLGAQAAVDAAVDDLGYEPNRAARSLVTRRTDSIALVVPEPDEKVLTDPFFAGTLRGLGAALEHTEFQLVLLIARLEASRPLAARYLRRGHVDGAIVVSHHRDDGLETVLANSRLPSVFVGRPWTEDERLPYVDADNLGGGRVATQHLLSVGCRRIATITGPMDRAVSLDRLRGWREVLTDAGRATVAIEHGDFTSAGGARAAAALMNEHPDTDGIFVASDLMAVGAMAVLAEWGLRVPEDVRIVGFDQLGVHESTRPALTTVTNPVVAMARRAGEILLDQIATGHRPHEPEIFPTELFLGDSA